MYNMPVHYRNFYINELVGAARKEEESRRQAAAHAARQNKSPYRPPVVEES